jgi:hypothetical protein
MGKVKNAQKILVRKPLENLPIRRSKIKCDHVIIKAAVGIL